MKVLAALALWELFSPIALLAADSRGPLNTHLPSWVTLGAQIRYRAEGTSRSYLLERYRPDVELRPAAWLGAVGPGRFVREHEDGKGKTLCAVFVEFSPVD